MSAVESLQKVLPDDSKIAAPVLTRSMWDGNWYVRRGVAAIVSELGIDAIDISELIDPWKDYEFGYKKNEFIQRSTTITRINRGILFSKKFRGKLYVREIQCEC